MESSRHQIIQPQPPAPELQSDVIHRLIADLPDPVPRHTQLLGQDVQRRPILDEARPDDPNLALIETRHAVAQHCETRPRSSPTSTGSASAAISTTPSPSSSARPAPIRSGDRTASAAAACS